MAPAGVRGIRAHEGPRADTLDAEHLRDECLPFCVCDMNHSYVCYMTHLDRLDAKHLRDVCLPFVCGMCVT